MVFSLPDGATKLEFQDGALGGRYIKTADGFGDTVSIPPGFGSYELLFAFEMPYDRNLELAHPVTMPVDAIVILAPEGDIKIKSDILQDSGVSDVQGTQYRTYSGGGLAAGDELRLTLTGKPSIGAPSLTTSSNTSLLVGLSVFGLALIMAGVWLYRRTRLNGADSLDAEQALDSSDSADFETSDSLMDAIIALDDLYQAGQLPDEAYQQRRDELKRRLKELIG